MGNEFGSKNYAKEELVAELGAMLLSKQYGLSDFSSEQNDNLRENSLAYLKNWFNSNLLIKDDLSDALKDAVKSANLISKYSQELDASKENERSKTKEIKSTVTSETQATPEV